jgi:cytochrome P450
MNESSAIVDDIGAWEPADSDGFSEDWIEQLADAAADGVVQTPIGLGFTRHADISHLVSSAALKVPVVEQWQMLEAPDVMIARAKKVILGLDGPTHTRLRGFVKRVFTPRTVAHLKAGAREYVEARLDEATGDDIDVLHDLVGRYPGTVVGGVLGVPESDIPMLSDLADVLVGAQFSFDRSIVDHVVATALQIDAYLLSLVQSKRAEGTGDDLLTSLLDAEVDGDRLTDDEIVSLAGSIVNAGIDTTRQQACLALALFADHPDQWIALRQDPRLVPNAVEEVLRFSPVVPWLTRVCREPLEFRGHEFATGDVLLLSVARANRDAELNPVHPDEFDVRRDTPRHLTFGFGAHYCLGAALARLELVELFSVLVERFETIRVVGEVPRRVPLGPYGVKNLRIAAPTVR